jgi:hypothetical protein
VARSYYGDKISKNIIETPEGYLICQNVPLGRIGWMEYHGNELPPIFNEPASKICKVFRSEEEVFSPATMASFEGKPVTNTHPLENLTIDSVAISERGHTQNIRRDGDFLVGDLHIKDNILKSEVLNNSKREISCGYDCAWIPLGDSKYEQKEILGNHVAVVENGRAGHRVKINDAAPKEKQEESEIKDESKPNDIIEKIKEKTGGKQRMGKVTEKLLAAMGFKHWAQDADPEEVAQALQAMKEDEQEKALFSKTPGSDDDMRGTAKNDEPVIPAKDDETPDAMNLIVERMNEVLKRIEQLESREEKQQGADESFSGLEGELSKKVADDDDDDDIRGQAQASDDDDDDTENTFGQENVKYQKAEQGSKVHDDDDDDDEVVHAVADKAIKKFVKDMKPVIMAIKDKKTRDEVASKFVASVRDSRKVGSGEGYANILQAVTKNKKSAMDKAVYNRESDAERCQKAVEAWNKAGNAARNKGGNQ